MAYLWERELQYWLLSTCKSLLEMCQIKEDWAITQIPESASQNSQADLTNEAEDLFVTCWEDTSALGCIYWFGFVLGGAWGSLCHLAIFTTSISERWRLCLKLCTWRRRARTQVFVRFEWAMLTVRMPWSTLYFAAFLISKAVESPWHKRFHVHARVTQ